MLIVHQRFAGASWRRSAIQRLSLETLYHRNSLVRSQSVSPTLRASNTLGLKCGPFRRISRKWMRTSGLDDTVQHGHLKGLPAMIRCDCRFWDPILWACYDLVDLNYFGLFSPLSRCHS